MIIVKGKNCRAQDARQSFYAASCMEFCCMFCAIRILFADVCAIWKLLALLGIDHYLEYHRVMVGVFKSVVYCFD